MFDYIVIGKGMMGSATARYLSEWGAKVALVGPDEPPNKTTHEGVFSSHYDQGRLARLLSRDKVWARIAKRSISQYRDIEQRSGVHFYEPVGVLIADKPSAFAERVEMAHEVEANYEFYGADDRSWEAKFADLAFPAGYAVMYEPDPAGYINPRAYIQAQLALMQKNEATIVPEIITQVRRDGSQWQVTTASGRNLSAQQVVVAAGAFTNFNNLLPRPVSLRIKTETIVLGRVAEETGQHLRHYPTVIYNIDDPQIDSIYMAPAIRYPDGHFYIKMGCNTATDVWPEMLADVQDWFRSGDSDTCKEAMASALQSLWPSVAFTAIESQRCIVCYTPSGYPTIDEVEQGLWVVTGGNGTGASKADGIGYLAAGQIMKGEWLLDVPRALFKLQK